MFKRIDHVAIIVKDLDDQLAYYDKTFGFKAHKVETLPEQQVRAALLQIGDTELELIQPITADSGVAKFLEKNGEIFHHICFEVDDINKSLTYMAEEQGCTLIDKKGRSGLAGTVGFIHPRSTRGVLVELAQKVKS